jgi:hypothetical protein
MVDCMRGSKTAICATIPGQKPDLPRHKGISARPWPVKIGFDDLAADQVTKSYQRNCPQDPPNGFFTKNLKGIKDDEHIQGDMKNGFPHEKRELIQNRVIQFTVQ